jgi:LDH2 family malate/lactate/ureidoglycolate dehydrogenase
MSELVRLTLQETHALAGAALGACGVSAEHARAIADTVTAAERDDCKSHGLFRVPGYAASVLSGKVDPRAEPVVQDRAPGVVHVDARGGFAPLALEQGSEPLAARARSQGVAALVVTDCYHFAALWPEVERLGEAGLAALAFVNAMSYVAPAGGTRPLYGTNPMAFAWPRAGHPPLVFDQASSASARGEIMLHGRDGMPLPEGWAIDPEGRPTTDPTAALAGAQLTFGGYKGAAIALMVELLAGPLVGDLFSFEAGERDNRDGGPPRGGELVIAMDPARCQARGEGYDPVTHAERLFERILAQEGARLPSQRRHDARRRTATEGIRIPVALHDEIRRLAES